MTLTNNSPTISTETNQYDIATQWVLANLIEQVESQSVSLSNIDSRDPDSTYVSVQRRSYLWNKIFNWFTKPKPKKYKTNEFFTLIKEWKSNLTTEKAEQYRQVVLNTIKNTTTLWQTKAIKQLESQAIGLLQEIQVINQLWLTEYVFESDISDLESIGIKDRTVWRKKIEDYVSIIPEECTSKIVEAKQSKLFDEIIVIYTRKKDRQMKLDKTKKTKWSRREKVDPICFWKINWTWRLFFICDWMDDECDLTFQKLQDETDIKAMNLV